MSASYWPAGIPTRGTGFRVCRIKGIPKPEFPNDTQSLMLVSSPQRFRIELARCLDRRQHLSRKARRTSTRTKDEDEKGSSTRPRRS